MNEINCNKQNILITGGSGFIGSHCVVAFAENGYEPIVVDNFSNSSLECIRRMEQIIGKSVVHYNIDINDYEALNDVFKKHKIHSVVHLAGFKSVGISINKSLDYYNNNVCGTINLLNVMNLNSVFNIIFASSATVYGTPLYLPIDEKHPVMASNIKSPYGKSKYMIELMLSDLSKADSRWNVTILRYFNPVGAHKSGLIGEDPIRSPPPNLMALVSQVAVGRYPFVSINGSDYDTPDGTGVRDYIHVCDLAYAHILAVEKLNGFKIYNLGSGERNSVLNMIKIMEKVSGKTINYQLLPRREGDVAIMDSDSTLAQTELNWKITKSIEEMCQDLWNFQTKNPNGYSEQ